MPTSLLPPNATALERSLEAGIARLGEIDTPVDTLVDPAAIDATWLPWLGWALSVDIWNPDWSEATKRAAVAGSIAAHRIKGTRLAVEQVLARFDELVHVIEWHEASPRRAPHTFEVVLPVAGAGVPEGGTRATAAFVEAIVRDVVQVKPLREHLTVVQSLAASFGVGVQVAGRALMTRRDDMAFTDDRSQPWESLLQTENGEPLQSDDGTFLEDAT